MRPLTSILGHRPDASVDRALREVRIAGWQPLSREHGERLLVGPGGVVLLAEHGGRIREEWGDAARARAEAIARMTDRTVHAVVVPTRHVEWTDPRPLRGATLVPAPALAAYLTGLPRCLGPAEADGLRVRMQHALAI